MEDTVLKGKGELGVSCKKVVLDHGTKYYCFLGKGHTGSHRACVGGIQVDWYDEEICGNAHIGSPGLPCIKRKGHKGNHGAHSIAPMEWENKDAAPSPQAQADDLRAAMNEPWCDTCEEPEDYLVREQHNKELGKAWHLYLCSEAKKGSVNKCERIAFYRPFVAGWVAKDKEPCRDVRGGEGDCRKVQWNG